jgi:hypothetical protein
MMDNDFQLFPEHAAGEIPIDADTALITAYLARELSVMQIVAVEDRLATDTTFRDLARPIIESWLVPGSLRGAGARRATPLSRSLTDAEIEAGWQRHAGGRADHSNAGALPPRSTPRSTHTTTLRRKSMARIAAIVALIVLPVIAFAEVMMYVANHTDVPTTAAQTEASREGPIAHAFSLAEREAKSSDGGPATGPGAAPPAVPKPDRARIAALVAEHHPLVVRADTLGDYVVMVLDAAEQYVWSTAGAGGVAIEVGGDRRTAAERAEYDREHAAQFIAPMRDSPTRSISSSTGALYIIDGVPLTSLKPITGALGGVAPSSPGNYLVGGTSPGNRLNHALGLQALGGGQSGIQGLLSGSVAGADAYLFRAGELGPRMIATIVVRLTPGSAWKGR